VTAVAIGTPKPIAILGDAKKSMPHSKQIGETENSFVQRTVSRKMISREKEMTETEHEKFIREQKEATERANAHAERIAAEHAAAKADQDRIRENQGEREPGHGGDE